MQRVGNKSGQAVPSTNKKQAYETTEKNIDTNKIFDEIQRCANRL